MAALDKHHTLTGAAERCCAVLCDYRPEMVAIYHQMIVTARRDGRDLTAELAETRGGTDSMGRSQGVSTDLDARFLRRIWDVERAMDEGASTVTEICRKLCPWSLDS